jgi:hypothetical protein
MLIEWGYSQSRIVLVQFLQRGRVSSHLTLRLRHVKLGTRKYSQSSNEIKMYHRLYGKKLHSALYGPTSLWRSSIHVI